MVLVIVYEFYAKEIASKALINARSAMSHEEKSAISSSTTCTIELQSTSTLGKCSGKSRGDGTENAVFGDGPVRSSGMKWLTLLSRLAEQDKRQN